MDVFALKISVIELDKSGFSALGEELAGPDGLILFFLAFGVGMPYVLQVNEDVILLPFALRDIGFEHAFLLILLESLDKILSMGRV